MPIKPDHILDTSLPGLAPAGASPPGSSTRGEAARSDELPPPKGGLPSGSLPPLDTRASELCKGGHRFAAVDEEAYSQVNWRRVEAMLEAGCNSKEIAGALGVRENTLFQGVQYRFSLVWTDYAERFIERGKAHLRLTQHEYAKAGNVALLIHLGKFRLNQREDPDSAPVISITVKRKDPSSTPAVVPGASAPGASAPGAPVP